MKERWEVVLAGSGGQGLIFAGTALGEAAVLEGKNATQTQSYGVASRGGFSKSEVIIDAEPVAYPMVRSADVIVALTQEAAERCAKIARDGALLICDSEAVKADIPRLRVAGLPLARAAREAGGKAVNMVALGVVVGLTGLVAPGSVEKSLAGRLPARSYEANWQAFLAGLGLVKAAGTAAVAIELPAWG